MKKLYILILVTFIVSCQRISEVKIHSLEGSQITINDEKFKSSLIKELIVNQEYTITVKKRGYNDVHKKIVITEDLDNIFIELEETPKKIRIETVPNETTLYLDDEIISNTPKLLSGTYKLRIEKDNYTTQEHTIIIKDNESDKSLSYNLDYDDLSLDEIWNEYGYGNYEALKITSDSKYMDKYILKEESPIYKSINERNFEMITFFIKNGYSQTFYSGIMDDLESCLFDSIEDNDIEMVKYLIESGVKKNLSKEAGNIYHDLSYAIRFNNPNIVKLLLEYDYNPNESIISYSNGENSSGINTYLYTTLYKNKLNIAKILLENGADPNQLILRYMDGELISNTILDNTENKSMINLLGKYNSKSKKDLNFSNYSKIKIGMLSKVIGDQINYYDKPITNSNILGTFNKDYEVIAITNFEEIKTNDEVVKWYLVNISNEQYAWVLAENLEVSRKVKRF